MRKKRIIRYVFVLSTVVLTGAATFYSKADDSTLSLMAALGVKFNKYASTGNDSEGALYAKGRTGTVTKAEVQQAKDFYMISGMPEDEAQIEAEEYMMQREALYNKAVEEGFGVSDEQIRT